MAALVEQLTEADQLKEAIATLRHIATTGCRCNWFDDDLIETCACDSAQVALETLRAMGVSLRP